MEPLTDKSDIVSGSHVVAEVLKREMRLGAGRSSRFVRAGLRGLDILIASALLLFLAPIMIVVALGYIFDRGPLFFGHRRIGQSGKEFHCLKFRTMVIDAQARLEGLLAADPEARLEWEATRKLKADPRITPIGRMLRRSSLDELPQLINVLRGDMSLVGPRPITLDERAYYGRFFSTYCAVQPGITGLWQISGRNDVSYRKRVALDVAFARSSKPFALYFGIMLRTPACVLRSVGSY
jgi:exopolysaccharide production protein ExoY